jgi:hypothetical protein
MLRNRLAAYAAVFLSMSASAPKAELPPETRLRALKVIAALEKLGEDGAGRTLRSPRSYTVPESDLNAWIAYKIATEVTKFVRSIEVRLLDGNRAEGKISIDLSGSAASFLLPPRAEFFFSARGESEDGKIRLTMDRLYLGTQRLSPAFIDTVIAVLAGLEGQPATSLHDWYALPYGIQRLESRPGQLVCHYD